MSRLSARTEDYLLAIFLLRKQSPPVRVSDISKTLEISAPGVTEAIKKLIAIGLVKHRKHSKIEFTSKGERIALNINLRYETLRQFLCNILNVPPNIAERDAKGMQHALSKTSQQKMRWMIEQLAENNTP